MTRAPIIRTDGYLDLAVMLNPRQHEYLSKLRLTGLYGSTLQEVAALFIQEGIRHAVAQGILELTPTPIEQPKEAKAG